MIDNAEALSVINSPVRTIKARVERYEGSTLVDTFKESDRLKEIKVERIGEESKFFGISICQKANIKLIDAKLELDVTTANHFKIYFNDVDCLPEFYVTEVNRDENTGELSITAYDKLNEASAHTVSELSFPVGAEEESSFSYDIAGFANACANLLGLSGVEVLNVNDACFSTVYEGGANFGGEELLREAITQVAEATQTVAYINHLNHLVFKRLDKDGEPNLTLDKSKYASLSSKTSKRLGTIYSVTELGNDVFASITETGSTAYVRENPFWNLREDIATLVDNALAAVGGLTINQFNCSWFGNFLLEPADKLALVTKDDEVVYSYVLNDTISYNGAYSQQTSWSYADNSAETANNPTSLGDVLKKTYATVDKQNQQIDLVASKVEANANEISAIQINVGSISQSVQSVEKQLQDTTEYVDGEIEELTKKVESTMTDEEVRFEISTALANGVTSVKTTTGFTFNEEGLTVSKNNSEMETTITEDGMSITRSGEEVLIANNEGVKAEDLHATTYLIVGQNTRWEDYPSPEYNRTGAFWIGKTEIDE